MRQTVHFQAKLNPSSEFEREAIRILEEKRRQGFSPRDILADALNRLGDKTPEMFTEHDQVNRIERMISSILERGIENILRSLKTSNPQELRQFVEAEDEQELEFTPDFIRNAKKAVRPGYRQSNPEEND